MNPSFDATAWTDTSYLSENRSTTAYNKLSRLSMTSLLAISLALHSQSCGPLGAPGPSLLSEWTEWPVRLGKHHTNYTRANHVGILHALFSINISLFATLHDKICNAKLKRKIIV